MLVQECKDALEKVVTTKDVKIKWVPGCNGFEINKQADKLAKYGFYLCLIKKIGISALKQLVLENNKDNLPKDTNRLEKSQF